MKIYQIVSGDPMVGVQIDFTTTDYELAKAYKKHLCDSKFSLLTIDTGHDEMVVREVLKYGHELSKEARKDENNQAYELVNDFVTKMLNRNPKEAYALLEELIDEQDGLLLEKYGSKNSYNLDIIIDALEIIKKKLGVK